MQNNYDIPCYDKYLCLKPNSTLWLVLLFLLRPYIVLVLSIVNREDRTFLINLVYPNNAMMSLGALASIPALLVIYAWSKRKPGAPEFVKNIWRKGRMLLTISAVLNACIAFAPLLIETDHSIHARGWIQFSVSLLIVLILYKSEYIRDCFSDFPKDEEITNK